MATGRKAATRRATALLLVAALALVVIPAAPAAAVDNRATTQIRAISMERVNAARTSRGLRELKVNRRLQYWAQDHAEYMASKRTLVHDGPVRLRLEAPVTALAWSENIARNTDSNAARRAHRMFMDSAGHRANILQRSSTHMGIGVVRRGDYVYIVQRFATLP